MVGESAVRLKELAAFDPRAQLFQHIGIEAACAIAGIHHDMQTQQGLLHLGIHAVDDQLFQMIGIGRQEAGFHRLGLGVNLFGLQGFSDSKHIIQLVEAKTAFSCKEFESIEHPGMMAGGDHNGAVRLETLGQNGHIHGRCGAHAIIDSLCACGENTLCSASNQSRAGNAAVASQCDAQLTGGFSGFFRQITGKRHTQHFGNVRCKNSFFTNGYAAYVRTTFQLAIIHF